MAPLWCVLRIRLRVRTHAFSQTAACVLRVGRMRKTAEDAGRMRKTAEDAGRMRLELWEALVALSLPVLISNHASLADFALFLCFAFISTVLCHHRQHLRLPCFWDDQKCQPSKNPPAAVAAHLHVDSDFGQN
ncbi:hypothetical protein L596_010708 [Steinernema carpocapsae]|uniref:Uncharacterized protein n=1 Tax=Steinernema carpocapsae TaxID=34508 RepID=A0A4U5PJ99_STECR|nr:hypothetical protein L596_010708 [Steinernema carpocapsae]